MQNNRLIKSTDSLMLIKCTILFQGANRHIYVICLTHNCADAQQRPGKGDHTTDPKLTSWWVEREKNCTGVR